MLTYSCGIMEPDLTKCKTSRVGTPIPGTDSEMFYCRLDYAECRYAMPFGYDYLCKHPDSLSFLIPEDAEPVTFAESLCASPKE